MPQSCPPGNRDPIRGVRDLATHLLQTSAKPDVPLQALLAQPFDAHPTAGDRRRGPEIASRRSVGLDRIVTSSVAAGGHLKSLASGVVVRRLRRRPPSPAAVISTYGFETSATGDLNFDRLPPCPARRARRHQQQSARELARNVGPNRNLVESQAVRIDHDGRATTSRLAASFYADVGQRVEQVLNRPLVHPRRAVQTKASVAQRHQRGQKPHRRAAVGDVQFGAVGRQLAAATNRRGPCSRRGRDRSRFPTPAAPRSSRACLRSRARPTASTCRGPGRRKPARDWSGSSSRAGGPWHRRVTSQWADCNALGHDVVDAATGCALRAPRSSTDDGRCARTRRRRQWPASIGSCHRAGRWPMISPRLPSALISTTWPAPFWAHAIQPIAHQRRRSPELALQARLATAIWPSAVLAHANTPARLTMYSRPPVEHGAGRARLQTGDVPNHLGLRSTRADAARSCPSTGTYTMPSPATGRRNRRRRRRRRSTTCGRVAGSCAVSRVGDCSSTTSFIRRGARHDTVGEDQLASCGRVDPPAAFAGRLVDAGGK